MNRTAQILQVVLPALLTTRLQVRRIVHIARQLQVTVHQVVVIVPVAAALVRAVAPAQVAQEVARVVVVQVVEEDKWKMLLQLNRNLTV